MYVGTWVILDLTPALLEKSVAGVLARTFSAKVLSFGMRVSAWEQCEVRHDIGHHHSGGFRLRPVSVLKSS